MEAMAYFIIKKIWNCVKCSKNLKTMDINEFTANCHLTFTFQSLNTLNVPRNKDVPTFRALRCHMIYELKEEEGGGWQIILNNGNTSLRGTVSMTPIGSKITLESAKTNRLQLCLLHSSSAQLNTHCHLRLPSVLTDSCKREADKKGAAPLISCNDRVRTWSPLSSVYH